MVQGGAIAAGVVVVPGVVANLVIRIRRGNTKEGEYKS